ncbi:MAG: TraB/GumN family protein [Saprospiraceae bacterium]|nr:TraB/GumN family protein [Saprospiraceae bacterium]
MKFNFRYGAVAGSFLLVLLLANCSSSQKAVQAVPAVTEYQPNEKSLLWEISGNGLTKSSYLFGTIHIIGSEDFFFPKTLEDKIIAADQATFEIDMDDMSSMESMFKIIGKAFMRDGLTLKDLVTGEEYKEIETHFTEKGLPLQMLDRMKPMLLSTFATMDIGGEGGMENSKSYEMEIFNKVNEQNKESKGLETIDDQLAIFDSIPYELQAKMLVESIRSADKENIEYKAMVDLYKKQDIETMAKVSVGDEGGMGAYEDLFLFQRNRNWIPLMSAMMKDKSTFFAVGAGHLGGPKGVINLLKSAGYKVKAVKIGLGA